MAKISTDDNRATTAPFTIPQEVIVQMESDIAAVIAELKIGTLDATSQRGIIDLFEAYAGQDAAMAQSKGRTQSPHLDRFISLTKQRTLLRSSWKTGFVEQLTLVLDAIMAELDPPLKERLKQLLASSSEKGAAVSNTPGDNLWLLLGKEEAMALWGLLKGMGTGVGGIADLAIWTLVRSMQASGVRVTDPPSAAAWLAKQYDISGGELFGADYNESNSATIGEAGGMVVWTLVTLGLTSGASAGNYTKLLAGMGIVGNLKGVEDGASAIAEAISRLQNQERLTISELAGDAGFIQGVTQLAASAFGAVTARVLSSQKTSEVLIARLSKIQLTLDVAQVAATVTAMVELVGSNRPPREKQRALILLAAQLATSVIAAATSLKDSKAADQRAANTKQLAAKALAHDGEQTPVISGLDLDRRDYRERESQPPRDPHEFTTEELEGAANKRLRPSSREASQRSRDQQAAIKDRHARGMAAKAKAVALENQSEFAEGADFHDATARLIDSRIASESPHRAYGDYGEVPLDPNENNVPTPSGAPASPDGARHEVEFSDLADVQRGLAEARLIDPSGVRSQVRRSQGALKGKGAGGAVPDVVITRDQALGGLVSKSRTPGSTSEWARAIRQKTPSEELRQWARASVERGQPDPVIPAIPMNNPSPDHIVPVEITEQLPGFGYLTIENQLKVHNNPGNFIVVDLAVNSARSSTPYSQLETLKVNGEVHFIAADVRARMATLETEALSKLRNQIEMLYKEQMARGLQIQSGGWGSPQKPLVEFRGITRGTSKNKASPGDEVR